jgi:hypothetical protein
MFMHGRVSERRTSPLFAALAVGLIFTSGPGYAGQLPPARIQAWNEYVRLTEERISRELASEEAFLVQDFGNPRASERARAALIAGDRLLGEMKSVRANGDEVDVPGGMIHHWRGSIFIPGVTLDQLLDDVMHPDAAAFQQRDVLETRVLDRGDNWLHLYLKLQRSKIITATYDTEHRVEYVRHGTDRASSRTVATSIRELADAGTPEERQKPEGEDRGFLWRLNSYWRYEQVDGGVFVECESVTLSRSIPFLAAVFIRPIVTSVARESLDRTLTSLKERMQSKKTSL